jgi:iron(III) transport system permease protein
MTWRQDLEKVYSVAAGRVRLANRQAVVFVLLAGLILYLVVAPLLIVLISSFQSTIDKLPFEHGVRFTLDNYRLIFSSPLVLKLTTNTLAFAVISILISMSLAMLFAWLVERTNMPGRSLLFTLIIVPMVIPGMVTSMAWALLLSPRTGILNEILRHIFNLSAEVGPLNIYTFWGMCFVQGMLHTPTVFLLVLPMLRSMDPSLEEASRIAGANFMSTLRRVTLPLASPAMMAALLYVFISAIESFDVPLILGTPAHFPVFTTQVYLYMYPPGGSSPNYGMASTFGAVIIAIAIVLMYLYSRSTRRAEKFVTITGKGYRPAPIDLGRWRYVAFAVVMVYVLIAIGLPFFILLWNSLVDFVQVPSIEAISHFSLKWYKVAFMGASKAISNTVILTVMSATAATVIAALASWFIVRSRMPGRRTLDVVTFLPHSIPGVIFGMAFIFLGLKAIPSFVYGTIWILVIALTAKSLAFPSRVMVAANLQIHKSLEEAALISGSPWGRTLRRINLPLMIPAALNGWILVALLVAKELTICLMLFSPSNVVISTSIWAYWQNGDVSETCALSVGLIVFVALLFFVARPMILKQPSTR